MKTFSKWLVTAAGPFTGFALWVNTMHPHIPTTADEWWGFFWQAAMFIGGGGLVAKGVNHGIDAVADAKSKAKGG